MQDKFHIRGRGIVLDGFITSSTNQQYPHLLTFDTASGEVGYFTGSVYGGNAPGTIGLTNGADNRVVTATGASGLNGETNLTFDGSTLLVAGNVSATSLTGSLQGTASWASNVVNASTATTANSSSIINTNTAGTFYPVFVANTGSNQFLQTDNTTLTFNPGTNTLTVANLTGNASTATTATTASSADNFIVRGNLVISGSTTIGDTTTDSIILNANSITLASTGTGSLNIDSNTFFVDGNNNRIGIGNNNPQFDVHVDLSKNMFFAGNGNSTTSTGLLIGQHHTTQSLSASRTYGIIGVADGDGIPGVTNGDIILSPRTNTTNTSILFVYTGSASGINVGQRFRRDGSYISGTFALPTIAQTNQTNFLAYNSSTGDVTYFSTSSISATTATTATTANSASITNTNTAGTFYPVFVANTGSNQFLQTDSTTLTYNPNSNTLTVANLAGNASTSTTASWVNGNVFDSNNPATTSSVAQNVRVIHQPSAFGPFYITFVDNTGGNRTIQTDNGLTYDSQNNALTASTFVGSLSGNATTATTATNANNVAVTNTNTDAVFYPTFVANTGSNEPIRTDSTTLTYNPSTNTLTAGTFVGSFTGTITGNASTATTANSSSITDNTSTNATHYLTFVANTGSNQYLQTDSATLTYNPSSNTLTVANLAGTATTANTASTADNFTVRGNLIVNGNTTIGDGSADNITLNASTVILAGNLNIDSNTLFVDGANNRVGIGTTAPTTALDVNGIITSVTTGTNTVLSVGQTTESFGRVVVRNGSSISPNTLLEVTSSKGVILFARTTGSDYDGNGQVWINAGYPSGGSGPTFRVSGSVSFLDIANQSQTSILGWSGGGAGLVTSFSTASLNAGTASNATNVAVTNSPTATGVFYPTFVANTIGYDNIEVDNTGITYNPANNRLGIGIGAITGSYNLDVSGSTNVARVKGSGSANPLFAVEGSLGELFSVTDNLSGSLFSVNDSSGLPILEVFSDNTTLLGTYAAPALHTTVRRTLNSGSSQVVYQLPTSSYDGMYIDYVVKSGSYARIGEIKLLHNAGQSGGVESLTSILGGANSNFTFEHALVSNNLALRAIVLTNGWTVKTIIRAI